METTLEIAEGAASNDPDAGLRAVAALRALTERLEIIQVQNARQLGWSWQDIAERLGVTKQTVHRKHGKRTGFALGTSAPELRTAILERGCQPG